MTKGRAGIAMQHNLQDRKNYWERQYKRIWNWREEGPYPTKTQAQQRENQLGAQPGWTSHPGGDGPEHAHWHVYSFNYEE